MIIIWGDYMKKVMKVLICLFILCMTFFSMTIYATSTATQIQSKGVVILNAIMWFGYAIALGMVVFIGIKYMLGAADEKANMKSAITSWLIGAFIVFLSSTIVGIVLSTIGVDNKKDTAEVMAQNMINSIGNVVGSNETNANNSNNKGASTPNNTQKETNNSKNTGKEANSSVNSGKGKNANNDKITTQKD